MGATDHRMNALATLKSLVIDKEIIDKKTINTEQLVEILNSFPSPDDLKKQAVELDTQIETINNDVESINSLLLNNTQTNLETALNDRKGELTTLLEQLTSFKSAIESKDFAKILEIALLWEYQLTLAQDIDTLSSVSDKDKTKELIEKHTALIKKYDIRRKTLKNELNISVKVKLDQGLKEKIEFYLWEREKKRTEAIEKDISNIQESLDEIPGDPLWRNINQKSTFYINTIEKLTGNHTSIPKDFIEKEVNKKIAENSKLQILKHLKSNDSKTNNNDLLENKLYKIKIHSAERKELEEYKEKFNAWEKRYTETGKEKIKAFLYDNNDNNKLSKKIIDYFGSNSYNDFNFVDIDEVLIAFLGKIKEHLTDGKIFLYDNWNLIDSWFEKQRKILNNIKEKLTNQSTETQDENLMRQLSQLINLDDGIWSIDNKTNKYQLRNAENNFRKLPARNNLDNIEQAKDVFQETLEITVGKYYWKINEILYRAKRKDLHNNLWYAISKEINLKSILEKIWYWQDENKIYKYFHELTNNQIRVIDNHEYIKWANNQLSIFERLLNDSKAIESQNKILWGLFTNRTNINKKIKETGHIDPDKISIYNRDSYKFFIEKIKDAIKDLQNRITDTNTTITNLWTTINENLWVLKNKKNYIQYYTEKFDSMLNRLKKLEAISLMWNNDKISKYDFPLLKTGKLEKNLLDARNMIIEIINDFFDPKSYYNITNIKTNTSEEWKAFIEALDDKINQEIHPLREYNNVLLRDTEQAVNELEQFKELWKTLESQGNKYIKLVDDL